MNGLEGKRVVNNSGLLDIRRDEGGTYRHEHGLVAIVILDNGANKVSSHMHHLKQMFIFTYLAL